MAVRSLEKGLSTIQSFDTYRRLVRFGRLCMLGAIDVRLEQLSFRRINVDDICP